MTETTDDLDRSAGDMMPSPGEIALRLRYLELGADDLALLRRIHPLLQPRLEPVIEAFYTHLLSMPVLRPLLGDGAALARLRRVQAGYFRSLTAGDYGDDYVRNRLRVGLVHQRIGLAPVWYLGGYRKYLTDLAPVLRELLRDSPDTFLPTYGALFKVVNFDMSLALDTYIQAGRRKLLGLKNYSEQIISSMPSGVMVVDGGGAVRTVNQAMLGILGGQRGGAGLRYDELVGASARGARRAPGGGPPPPPPPAAPAPDWTNTGNITLASDYLFRGIS
ncbi:protoglobin domain-containing protein, partial [Duganella sp. Dugasp56]|uniref:protoglobin domain-containing protein n=1 Tax=Duganella sp. Dugasp56 TaxID=3243046 RepID=UPI0039B11F88